MKFTWHCFPHSSSAHGAHCWLLCLVFKRCKWGHWSESLAAIPLQLCCGISVSPEAKSPARKQRLIRRMMRNLLWCVCVVDHWGGQYVKRALLPAPGAGFHLLLFRRLHLLLLFTETAAGMDHGSSIKGKSVCTKFSQLNRHVIKRTVFSLINALNVMHQ